MSTVTVKPWSELTPTEVYALASLRTEVFCIEQGCTEPELDWRDLEPATEHYLLRDAGDAGDAGDTGHAAGRGLAAYLRVLVNSEAETVAGEETAHLAVGRVVTAAAHRGEGLASRLMDEVVARHGGERMVLHAQTYAVGLYARSGFVPVGEEFDEGGIPHITMVRGADAS